MYYSMSQDELRSLCRVNIEAFEKWARIIINNELTDLYGADYFDYYINNDNPVIKKSIRDKSVKMMKEHPNRFKRKIDTLFLDEIIYILCKKDLYQNCFKQFLDTIYPDGNAEAKTFLSRIIPIRNSLSHSNPISVRDAERCICYTNDFIEGVKLYFEKKGEQRMFNTPNVIKLNDSLGNERYLNKDKSFDMVEIIDVNTGNLQKLHVGEKYAVTLTLDPSFGVEEYIFSWSISSKELGKTANLNVDITEDMIRERLAIYCTIKSNKNWHRYNGYDQQFAIVFQVPPTP